MGRLIGECDLDLNFPCGLWRHWNWQSPLNGLIESIARINKLPFAQKWILRTHYFFLSLPLMKVISVLLVFFFAPALFRSNTMWTCYGYWHSGDCPVSIRFSFEWIVFRCTGNRPSELYTTHIQSTLICLDVSNQWCVRERASTLATFNGNDVFCHSTFLLLLFRFRCCMGCSARIVFH